MNIIPIRLIAVCLFVMATITMLFVLSCSDDKVTTPSPPIATDTISPGAIANLTVGRLSDTSLALVWTAPGDDGFAGTAKSYDIRYSTDSTTLIGWSSASGVSNPPLPALSGSIQRDTIYGLDPRTVFFFAIKSSDDSGNVSGLSNVAASLTTSNPSVTIVQPANGSKVADLVEIEATAADDKGILKVDFYVDATFLSSKAAPPYRVNWNASGLGHGTNHVIYASATDVDGNKTSSATVTCSIDTSIAVPAPVIVFTPDQVTTSSARITWTKSDESDFSRYTVEIDTSGSLSGHWKSSTSVTNRLDTVRTIALQDNWQYGFRVVCTDLYNRTSRSNVVSAKTADRIPTASNIISVSRVAAASIKLDWNQCSDYDFSHYYVYASADTIVTTSDSRLSSAQGRTATSFTYKPQDSFRVVTYGVVVVDRSGGTAVGQTRTLSARPSPLSTTASGVSASGMTLRWPRSADTFFSSYELSYDTISSMGAGAVKVNISNRSDTTRTLSALRENTTYYYQVTVKDNLGFTGTGNVGSSKTTNLPPQVPSLTATKISKSSIRLDWSASQAHDFLSYVVYRSLDSNTVFNSVLTTITQRGTISYTDNTVDSGRVYYYGLRVNDNAGLYSLSTKVRIAVKFSKALQFDGVDDFATIPYSSTFFVNGSFTIEFWTFWRNGARVEFPFSHVVDHIDVQMGGENIEFIWAGGVCRPGHQYGAFEWKHFALAYSAISNEMRLFVDGQSVATASCIPQPASTSGIILGRRANTSFRYTGALDEIRIWNYARTPQQVSANYKRAVESESGLVGRWSLDEGTGTSFSGQGPIGSFGGGASNPIWVTGAPIDY